MTDPVQEQLSACLDNELPEAELGLLLKRLGRDSQWGEAIGRYALIREILRDPRPARASNGFAAKVSAVIAVHHIPSRPPLRLPGNALRWLKPVAGAAVAAGVAAVAVVTLQPRTEPIRQVADAAQAPRPAAPVNENPNYFVPTLSAPTAFIPATRLTNYMVAHSEYATPLGRRTVLNGVLSEDDTLNGELGELAAEPDVSISRP